MIEEKPERPDSSPASWPRRIYRKHRKKLIFAQFATVFVLGIFFAWLLLGENPSATSDEAVVSATVASSEGPTMWTCSMHPQIRSPKPGQCPLCGMDLIPVAKTAGGMRTLSISSEARALMSIETAPVERRYVTHSIPMVGKVDYDETKKGYITAWVAGRLDRLFVDFAGIEVKKDDHMVSIYSEELYAAQEELIQALKYARDRSATANRLGISDFNLVESAREKLRLLGLKESQIKEIETSNAPSALVTIYAPVSGVVIEKLRQEGERVRLGDRIYTIADLRRVWVHLDAYESDLPWIRYGQHVTITTEAYPGDEFDGRISFIQPVLNDKTRTVKVRVNVPNLTGKLKPEMFVHAEVRPKVAAGGRVMDPDLAGKWICPMHPEIVKDVPGRCDICEMPLVRAESLGYVTPGSDQKQPPLVIPYAAVLPTGTRAVVYVELPVIHSAIEPALLTLSEAVESGKLDEIRDAFAAFSGMLDRPYDQPGTEYASRTWNRLADQLASPALAGQSAESVEVARKEFARVEMVMTEVREKFAPPGQPTFEGREIVLGPRAGDFYLVRHGLEEGEMIVRQGNFKIDAEVQIQAKPSMMTPQGGGNASDMQAGTDADAGHKMTLPPAFQLGLRDLISDYDSVSKAVASAELTQVRTAFDQFGKTLSGIDARQLVGHPRMMWKELSMLLGNDVAEGRELEQWTEAQRVYLLLKSHVRRLRAQFLSSSPRARTVERIEVAAEFQNELGRLWNAYLALGQALAADDLSTAQAAIPNLDTALSTLDSGSLTSEAARSLWDRERTNLAKLIGQLKTAEDIQALRSEFRPLSEEIGVLAKAFGFGHDRPVYELHCPMAFEGQGADWYQANDDVKNPYFGSTMLSCADRVEKISREDPSRTEQPAEDNRSQN